MPQASDELRARMEKRFRDAIDENGPISFLTAAGYVLRPDFYWTPPANVACVDDMTEDEWECMLFLMSEWDYGNLWFDQ